MKKICGEIFIETSKPLKQGILHINSEKEISSLMKNLDVVKVKENTEITSIKNIDETNKDEKLESVNYSIADIKDSQSNLEIELNNNTWTNETQNNVVFNVKMKNNDSKYELFKNPVIKIVLPQEVEKAILGDISIVAGDTLNVKNAVINEENGNKVLTLELNGEQNQYNINSINEETIVTVNATIILGKQIQTDSTKLEVSYTNNVLSKDGFVGVNNSLEDIQIGIIRVNNKDVETVNTIGESNNVQESNKEVNANENNQKGIDIQSLKDQNALEINAYAQIGNKKLTNADTIHSTEVVKYVVEVKNTSNETINDVQIKGTIPEGSSYATVDIGSYFDENYSYVKDEERKEYVQRIDTIGAGETKQIFYEVVLDELGESQNERDLKSNITVNVGDEEYQNTEIANKVIPSKLKVFLKSYIGRDERDEFYYWIEVQNLTKEELQNLHIETSTLQKEINVVSMYYYDDSYGNGGETEDDTGVQEYPFGEIIDGKIQGNVDKLNIYTQGEVDDDEPVMGSDLSNTLQIVVKFMADNFDEDVNEVPLITSFKAYLEDDPDDVYYSNENRRNAYPEYVKVSMSADKEGEEVHQGDIVNFRLEVSNPSKIKTNINIQDFLPEQVEGVSISYDNYIIEEGEYDDITTGTIYDIEEEANVKYELERVERDLSYEEDEETGERLPEINENVDIPAGKVLTIEFSVQAGYVPETTTVSNYATVSGHYINTVTSNIVTFTIVPDEEDTPGGDDGNDDDVQEVELNKIKGLVWEDANKDGKRDSTENMISGITVSLYDAETQSIAKDANGNFQKVLTDDQGEYTFENVDNGSYWVLFEYDSNKYNVTTYQKQGVETTRNSDAIERTVNINGTQTKVGMTDTLNINDNGLSNIDMGLITKEKFDMKLDKYISKVSVTTKNGTKDYSYENAQFAKVEIRAKEINNSKITIEYKIVVTNEGDLEGYVTSIKDIIPQGFEFNVADNKGWVKEGDNIVNKTLANQFINPGESQELTLVLTKTLNGDSTGTVVNAAEIQEVKNALNIEDADSTPNNANENEDDYSKAELLISISTGIVTYTIIIVGAIAVLSIAIILIRKKKINIKKISKISMFAITIGIAIFGITYENASNAAYTYLDSPLYISIYGGTEGNYTFKDKQGNSYSCASPNYHQCATWRTSAWHAYGKYSQSVISTKSSKKTLYTPTITKINKDKDTIPNVPDDRHSLIGPYTIKVSHDGILKNIYIYYEQDGVVKSKNAVLCYEDGSYVNESNKENPNITLKAGREYNFYVRVVNNVTEVSSAKVNVQFNKVSQTTTTTKYKRTYVCTAVGSGTHGGTKPHPTTGQVQKMTRNVKGSKTTTNNVTKSVTFGKANIKYPGSIKIVKTDSTSDEEPLEGVKFTIRQTKDENGDKISELKYATGKLDSDGIQVYSKTPVEFTTDENGEIYVEELAAGTYEVKETQALAGYEIDTTTKNVVLKGDAETEEVNFTNKRKYIDIRGTVWQDIAYDDGKNSDANELYYASQDDVNDKLLGDVIVRLKDKSGKVIQEVKTDREDNNGNYVLENVLIDELPNYYVEFEYNGMGYEAVTVKADKNNGNKAAEGNARKEFDNNYAIINDEGSADNNGNKTYDLDYVSGNNTSQLVYGDKPIYGYEGAQEAGEFPIAGIYDQYKITANTLDGLGGYLDKVCTDNDIVNGQISNINLGLWKREQPDLSVVKDVDRATVNIENETHIYDYADRFKKNDSGEYVNNGHDPQVKFGNKYGSMSYTRALYASDIEYGKNNNDALEVYVTYKISVRNQATNLNANVYELDDYFDTKYELVKVGREINNDGSIKSGTELQHTTPSTVRGTEYNKMTLSNGNNPIFENLAPFTEGFIYVQLKVKDQDIYSILDNNNEEVKLDNITEMKSYGTTITNEDGKQEIYAGVDKNSRPGNVNPSDEKTFEDDTDRAPGLLLVLQDEEYERKITGSVFIDTDVNDITNEEMGVHTGEVRQGNGIFDNDEEGLAGVKVKLVNSDGEVVSDTETDGNGMYTLSGFIPGEYTIQYEWGDNEHRVQDYKSTVVDKSNWNYKNSNMEWYKVDSETRESDAIDNWQTRQNIDNQTETITYGNKQQVDNAYNNTGSSSITTKMISTTPKFKVALESTGTSSDIEDEYEVDEDGNPIKKDEFKNVIRNIDFGIIERAKQALQLNKNITSAKITLADGNVIANASLNDKGELEAMTPYVSVIDRSNANNGMVRIEIDEEIVQGATLEIEYGLNVTNISELDYNTEDFYNFGIMGNDNNKVFLTPSIVIDYIDKNMAVETDDKWNIASDDLLEDGHLTSDLEDLFKQNGKILTTNQLASVKLIPGGSSTTISVSLKGYKVLSNNDETFLENQAEIIEVKKNGGRSLITTPGNYVPGNSSTKEVDDSTSESVTILPPTGLSTNYIAYITLTLSCLGILISGIVLIKKFVIGKNK